jgi:hypothetical protein
MTRKMRKKMGHFQCKEKIKSSNERENGPVMCVDINAHALSK